MSWTMEIILNPYDCHVPPPATHKLPKQPPSKFGADCLFGGCTNTIAYVGIVQVQSIEYNPVKNQHPEMVSVPVLSHAVRP